MWSCTDNMLRWEIAKVGSIDRQGVGAICGQDRRSQVATAARMPSAGTGGGLVAGDPAHHVVHAGSQA